MILEEHSSMYTVVELQQVDKKRGLMPALSNLDLEYTARQLRTDRFVAYAVHTSSGPAAGVRDARLAEVLVYAQFEARADAASAAVPSPKEKPVIRAASSGPRRRGSTRTTLSTGLRAYRLRSQTGSGLMVLNPQSRHVVATFTAGVCGGRGGSRLVQQMAGVQASVAEADGCVYSMLHVARRSGGASVVSDMPLSDASRQDEAKRNDDRPVPQVLVRTTAAPAVILYMQWRSAMACKKYFSTEHARKMAASVAKRCDSAWWSGLRVWQLCTVN